MHGVSFAGSLTDQAAPEHYTQQYFETIGNRAMQRTAVACDEDRAHPVGHHAGRLKP